MFLVTASIPSDTSSCQNVRNSSLSWCTRSFFSSLDLSSAYRLSRSAKVSDHAASKRSESSSAADSRPTDERTRDNSSEAAPLIARRPSSGLQIVHPTRALRHMRPSVPDDVAKTVACSIVGSRLDYCNSLFAGTSAV